MNEYEHGGVVVGVDGSPDSRTALEFAVAEAALRHAPLRVITAVPPPEYWVATYGVFTPPPLDLVTANAEALARAELDVVVTARRDTLPPDISVESRAGAPGRVLVEAAEGADLLVVGHRGRGAFGSALLGSVGLHCVLHAPCPVVVVRPAAVRAEASEPAAAARPAAARPAVPVTL